MESPKKQNLPHELRGKLVAFDSALTEVENRFAPLLKVPRVELNATLSAIDKAKLDLVAAYGINSLFWMYLNVCGVNPKDHGIKQELERIRSYMGRVKELQDKEKAPKVDVQASKRIVKSALWQAAQKGIKPLEPTEADMAGPSKEQKGRKRKSEEHEERTTEEHDDDKKKKKKRKKKKNKD